MPIVPSRRVQRVRPSPTLALTVLVNRLRAEGRNIIGLGIGEPDFDTPAPIAAAGIAAIRSGRTRYTNVDGTPELKDAIIAKFRRENRLEYARDQVLVSSGAKQTIFNLCLALLDAGDEVIIPAPYWVSYPDMVLLADAEPVIVPAGPEQAYKITPLQLEAAITPRTRLLLLNSPSNPTGAAYSRTELMALGKVLERHPRVVIGTDDIYEHIWWGTEPFCSLAEACPNLHERTVTINGVSKGYAMTGWRIGFCGGPRELVAAMTTIQGQSTSNPSSISQAAAVAALLGDQESVRQMNLVFKERHDFVVGALNALPGVSCLPGQGTFYAFADIRRCLAHRGMNSDTDMATHLLETAGVALVPGSAFGAPGHLRLSFASNLETLREAIQRIGRAIG